MACRWLGRSNIREYCCCCHQGTLSGCLLDKDAQKAAFTRYSLVPPGLDKIAVGKFVIHKPGVRREPIAPALVDTTSPAAEA